MILKIYSDDRNKLFTRKNVDFSGFTIVELLVVIVIIGILAAITIVSYIGISQKAIAASLTSDLDNASRQLKLFQITNGLYPATINCSQANSSTNQCIKSSSGNTFTYLPNNVTTPPTFSLTETNTNNTSYVITENTTPTQVIASVCLAGFIPVPGSGTYGTSDFCVMKYEAKNDGSGKAISVAAGLPWVNISQTNAISTSTAACAGCHLITEAEWMTIAQNVLKVPSNWSSGTVGSGYIYSGHNDTAPNNSLVADSNDANGYSGETNTGGDQRRTLTLSNGQVIWDMAGNVHDWTSGTSTNNQPGISSGGYNWSEWSAVTINGSLAVNPFPSSTGITGASAWNSSNGIGRIMSNSTETVLHSIVRGGAASFTSAAGILSLNFGGTADSVSPSVGFRVSR